jgi:Cys-rich repeat protein
VRRDAARRSSTHTRAALGAVVVLLGCNVYEGRTLDLFTNSEGVAVECQVSPDCPRERPACARGACVECVLDDDCGPARPACVGNVCAECRTADDCGGNRACNPILSSCAPSCTEPSHCAGQPLTQCSPELDVCVQCLLDADCTEPRRPACDRGGRCVECTSDAQCGGPRPFCQESTRTCVECAAQGQCADGVCDLRDGRCVECTTDADCGGSSCDPGRRRCVRPCAGPADCEPRRPVCDLASGSCIECTSDTECTDPRRQACGAELECVECTSDAHCTEPNRRACVIATERCGECTTDDHCTAMQRCDRERATCVPIAPPAPPAPGPAPPGP